jgi:ATP-dependent helicase/DNAse subunit B
VLPRERLACLAAAVGDDVRPDALGDSEPLAALYAALLQEEPERVERLRSPVDRRRPYHLAHPAVLSHWRGRRQTYTVSELEKALACPFQHYLAYRLRLRGAAESAGPLDQGQILHEALRRFFTEVRGGPFPDPEEAAARLRAICRALFDEVPMDARPYRVRLAEGAILRYLEVFLEREREFREATLLEPRHLEFAFGPQREADEDEGRGPTDVASTQQSLVLRHGDTEVCLSGKIDRIDLAPGGRHAFVFDYKLGKAPAKSLREGESLQMPVYWLAVEQLLGLSPVGGAYDAMRERRREVFARCDLTDHAFSNKGIIGKNALGKIQFEALLEQARANVVQAAGLIERLEVAPMPAKPATCRYCHLKDCCRPEEAGIQFDPEAEGESPDE